MISTSDGQWDCGNSTPAVRNSAILLIIKFQVSDWDVLYLGMPQLLVLPTRSVIPPCDSDLDAEAKY